MAKILNTISRTKGAVTPGERRFGRRVESHLEDDYLCWYDVPVGDMRRYPDFVILHPSRGLLLLEVKDWKIHEFVNIDKQRVTIQFGGKPKVMANPLEQARQCLMQLVNRLALDPALIQGEGSYQGKLCMPYGYGTVLPNITRKQLNDTFSEDEQREVLPEQLVITKDEMTESVDPLGFQEKLWGMFSYSFGAPLSLPQLDRVRWHIFPEVRINPVQTDLFADNSEPADEIKIDIPDIVRVMDIQQEQLARSLGSGHRVIHGVAGSGKTLILGFRCQQLASSLHKPILVLCYNVTLASYLRSFITRNGIEDKVHVHHFHEWCKLQLETYNVETLKTGGQAYERQVESVIHGVEKGLIPRAQYGAIMIDEGQDFEPEWLKIVTQMVDPATDSLLLLYDDAQSIYKKQGGLDFSLSSVGIKAQGRTTVLRLNYRNTREILDFAYRFAESFLTPTDADEDHIPLIAPETAGVSGPQPVFKPRTNLEDEVDFAVRCIHQWNQKGEKLSDMAVIYINRSHGKKVADSLQREAIKCLLMDQKKSKAAYDPHTDQVSIVSAKSSKGLEFKRVIIIGVGHVSEAENRCSEMTKLLYVGMTRAKENLLITASNNNMYTKKIVEITDLREAVANAQQPVAS
ncbi:NERD domain-containing protein [Verrucomicrobiaceae bacterium 5K15]|uniref:NERD domain-containing protein n=1 Tax=Oceaniferula flava TaxID=2800421 RepID=A0AAE2SBJ3_9BACT|nr:3'-5' exonuclease [Oceaniferula flavus]MBK1854719.1 NERD domain-containing protein [Oceaniferula flavus]MBM1136025.1 NERD domain-containing protein [Oceaniferula flavus]